MINRTRYKSLDKLASYNVVEVWDEGEDGIWAQLAPGYSWEGCSCLHEWSCKDLLAQAHNVEKDDFYLHTRGDAKALE